MMAMEVLSRILIEVVENKDYEYHWKCKPSKITHLCFLDDLILFCNVEKKSIALLAEALDKFKEWSNLRHNNAKSIVYFSGLSQEKRKKFACMLSIEKGLFPFKYLSVSMVDSKLTYNDYKPLIDKILGRTNLWKSKFL